MGFCELLTLIFVVLKLVHVIAWPWLYVFAPVLIEVVITLVAALIAFAVGGAIVYFGSR